jgi:uncharacterized membrane protein YeaQ/YmgE (transglycosylase-associated protein family)
MAIIAFILFGLIIGLLSRALMPGRQKLGLALTTALGCAGSIIGGFLANLISGRPVTVLTTAGFFGSLIGAFLLLMLVTPMMRRRQRWV